jgi:hypothetical protein
MRAPAPSSGYSLSIFAADRKVTVLSTRAIQTGGAPPLRLPAGLPGDSGSSVQQSSDG